MEFTIRNLGLIKHASMEIRPLTLLVGPNGTNKTWAASVLWGLLSNLASRGAQVEGVRRAFERAPDAGKRLIRVLAPALRTRSAQERPIRITITLDFDRIAGSTMPCIVSTDGPALFRNVLGTDEGLSKASAQLRFRRDEFKARVKEARLSWDPRRRLIELDPVNGPPVRARLSGTEIPEIGMLRVAKEALWAMCPDAFFFPAERKAMVSTYRFLMSVRSDLPTVALNELMNWVWLFWNDEILM